MAEEQNNSLKGEVEVTPIKLKLGGEASGKGIIDKIPLILAVVCFIVSIFFITVIVMSPLSSENYLWDIIYKSGAVIVILLMFMFLIGKFL